MRNVVAKLVIGAAITAIGMFGADNSIGTWKRNMEKSKSNPPVTNPIKSVTMVREASGDGVKVTSTGVREDGTAVNWSYTAKYDGKEYPVTGNAPFDTVSIKQIDANTFTTVLSKKEWQVSHHWSNGHFKRREDLDIDDQGNGCRRKALYANHRIRKAISESPVVTPTEQVLPAQPVRVSRHW